MKRKVASMKYLDGCKKASLELPGMPYALFFIRFSVLFAISVSMLPNQDDINHSSDVAYLG